MSWSGSGSHPPNGYWHHYIAGKGGAGGDAAKAVAGRAYGQGGQGGHGGGGGGCQGGGYGESDYLIQSGINLQTGGTGGRGGIGGDGAPGCVILYYRKPKPDKSGPLVTSNKRIILDRLGRRIIV